MDRRWQMKMNAETDCESTARAGLYELYARILLREIDLNTLTLFHTADWMTCFSALEIEIPPVGEESVEALAVDYCRVFIGPKDFCPPYQSVWESGHLQSDVIDSMNEYLEVVSPVTSEGIKDHAGLQFEMMAQILRVEAVSDKDLGQLPRAFFHDHIVWSDRMFGLAASLAETDFYSGLLDAAQAFLASEKTTMQFGQDG